MSEREANHLRVDADQALPEAVEELDRLWEALLAGEDGPGNDGSADLALIQGLYALSGDEPRRSARRWRRISGGDQSRLVAPSKSSPGALHLVPGAFPGAAVSWLVAAVLLLAVVGGAIGGNWGLDGHDPASTLAASEVATATESLDCTTSALVRSQTVGTERVPQNVTAIVQPTATSVERVGAATGCR